MDAIGQHSDDRSDGRGECALNPPDTGLAQDGDRASEEGGRRLRAQARSRPRPSLVVDHTHLFHRDQPAAHHAVDFREDAVNMLFAIDDLDHDR